MKKGKYVKLGTYQNVRIGYGTIDYINLKTIFLSLKSWIIPITDDDYDYVISKTRKKIKKHLYSINNDLFHKETIVDLNIKSNRLKINKKTFMDNEITLYTKKNFDLKNPEIKNMIKNIIENIIDNDFNNKNLYNFIKK